MDPELLKARRFIEEKIFRFLAQRQPPTNVISQRRIVDIVKRLEEGLFKTAVSQEEYLNLDTLESRLHVFIKRPQFSNNNPQRSQSTSAPVGTMIPTPGMSQHGNSNLIASAVDSSAVSAGSSAYLLPTENGSSAGMHGVSTRTSDGGSLANGYQQSHANFSSNMGGNNIISSMGGQRAMSQMIPTPGFPSSNNTFMNMESASNGIDFSNNDSSLAAQRLPQKQPIGNQNSSPMQSLGNQMGGVMRSSVQLRPYSSQDGSGNGGFGSYSQPLNGSGSSEDYLTATEIGGSPKSLHQQFDQQQQPLMQGDGYVMNAVDTSGSANFFSSATPVGSIVNNQNFNQVRLQSIPRSKSLTSNQPNLQNIQSASHLRPQSNDRSEKLSFQSSQSSKESLLLPHQRYQPQSNQLQQHPSFALNQSQQRQSSQQHQVLITNDALHSSQLSSVGHHVKTEHGIEPLHEGLQSQVSGQFQLSEVQNQFPQSSADICPTSTQFSHDMCPTLTQNPQQMLQSHQLGHGAQNKFSSLPIGAQSDSLLQGQYHHESDDKSSFPGGLSHELKVHEDFRQRISGHDDAQCNNLPCESSINGQNAAIRGSAGIPNVSSTFGRSVNANRERQYRNQQKWLLFLCHARRCTAPEGKCIENCITAQKLCSHMDGCNKSSCTYARCQHTKVLINHHKNCKDSGCPVCVPVKKFLQAQLRACYLRKSDAAFKGSTGGVFKSSSVGGINVRETSKLYPTVETTENSQPSLKRLKPEPLCNSISPKSTTELVPFHASNEAQVTLDLQTDNNDSSMHLRSDNVEVMTETPRSSAPNIADIKDRLGSSGKTDVVKVLNDVVSSVKQENDRVEKDVSQIKQEEKPQISEHSVGTKSGKPKIKGVSMTELFTPEQVRDHIRSLRQWVGQQSKTKAEKNQAMEHSMSENSCQLCAVEKLTFEPPPIYCSRYGCRIKRNAMYYTFGVGDTRQYFCIPCYNEARGDSITVEGTPVPKARLEKKKNDEETEEWWVQCDKCEAWQHQICALFNGRRNDGGQAEYTCPNCYIEEIENGERKPLPQSAVLGAKDLPRTILSDHIEQRLFKCLKYERQERARAQGKCYDEIPGVDGIVVRVVSSVDKKLEVKPRFLEIFREENYPTEFPYKSKAILLFQKIEGVEVCLFGMYVQEFGSESLPPNQRRVYLSYLDSVKYFRPDVRTVSGEALRTYVYHEILIGYLDYCKKRGFTSCYIWACPPLKGEDYILYCHPEIQKTPKSDKLREWYLSMLKKASKENIVVELTNFYDHFFVSNGECKAKVTAARLPYFDGDYWPGAAEEFIEQLNQEEDGRKQNKKGTTKKAFTKRALKASGQSDPSSNASKDVLLMHKLGDAIMPMKDDFIMVHLQYSCTHCCTLMVSGNRWVCKQCKNFQICDECYEAEQKLDEKERHPTGNKDMHPLFPTEIIGVPDDTKDRDDILESEFFDTRQAFLSLCQGNHYQYDTLRRAKHSSMMVLYHLHNPTAPAFVTTCNKCTLDIETGQGWRCETCPDYDVCNACYQKEGGTDHPHKLTNHPSLVDAQAQNKEARQQRVVQLRKMLDLLVHASQCRSPNCTYPNCRKVKGLFRHGIQCKVRASAGCVLCKKMWYLLQLHARACKESECHVPRCRDLREHLRRLQQQSDSRRRAAVMEMMRQRAAEVAGNSG